MKFKTASLIILTLVSISHLSLAASSDPVELPVSEVFVNEDLNIVVTSNSNLNCNRVTLNPQGMSEEYHMRYQKFPLALLGWDCVPSSRVQRVSLNSNLKDIIYDFVQEKSGNWTLTFANSAIQHVLTF